MTTTIELSIPPALEARAETRAVQARWALTPIRERLRVVRELRHLIAENADALAVAAGAVSGRPLAEKLVSEVLPLADACRWLERNAGRVLLPRRCGKRGRPFWLQGVSFDVQRQPLGVVLVIGPGNYPLFLPAVHSLHALIAGNAVLLKPAPGTREVALAFSNLAHGAGLDPALLTILPESVEAARRAIADGVDKVIFTGSSENGREVLSALAGTNTPSVMELSGQDAVLVLADADLELVVRALRFGTRLNAGETCIAPRRLVVVQSIADDLLARLSAAHVPRLLVERVRDDATAVHRANAAGCALGASIFSRRHPEGPRTRRTHQDRLRPHQRPDRPDRRSPHAIWRREGQRLRHHARRRRPAGDDLPARRRRSPRPHASAFRRARRWRRAPFHNLHPRRARPTSLRLRSASSSPRSSRNPNAESYETHRHHRRRTRRPFRSLRARRARARSHALRAQRLARRQGRATPRRRLPLRHGADHRHDSVGAAPHLRRGRRASGGLPRARAARPAVALFLRRRLGARPRAESQTRWLQTLDAFAPGTNSGARYREFIDYSARLDGISQRHFFYKPIGGLRDMFEWKASFDPKMLGDVLAMRMGRSVAGTVRAFTPDPRVAQMIDHFTQYVGSSPYGSPAVLCGIAHMQTDEGVWYPRRRHARRAASAGEARDANSASSSAPARRSRRSCRAAAKSPACAPTPARRSRCSAVVSNCDSVRTHRELHQRRRRRGASSGGAATSPPAPASCSTSA